MPRRRAIVDALALAAALWSAGCGGVDTIRLSYGALDGPGWGTGPVQLTLQALSSPQPVLSIEVRALRLPAPMASFRSLDLRCPGFSREGALLRCARARAALAGAKGKPVQLEVALVMDLDARSVQISVPRQAFLGGKLSMSLKVANDGVELDSKMDDVALPALAGMLLAPATSGQLEVAAGTVSGQLQLGHGPGRSRVAAAVTLRGATFSDDSGLRAVEELGMNVQARLERNHEEWSGELELEIGEGAVYVDPVLLDASDTPVRARFPTLRVDPTGIQVLEARVEQRGVLLVSGGGRLETHPRLKLSRLALRTPVTPLEPVYRTLLQPFAASGALSDLSMSGTAELSVDWVAGGPSALILDLQQVDVGDRAGRFTVLGLGGSLAWSEGGATPATRLRLDAAALGRLELGPVTVDAALQGRGLRLLEAVSIPLLDGRLRIERLDISGLGTPDLRMELESELEPISMQALSQSMSWLPLSGTISGRVPALVFENDRLQVMGDLQLALFDGRSRISGLSVAYPFSAVPETRANIVFEDLSLEQLSRSLSFGSVEGRVSGRVDALLMEGLRPVAFDAFLATPPGDVSRHRISQRAVNNLASLGGAGAVLSGTFLRLFKTFSYDRLGLGCRLQAGVCQMRGVEEASSGYYIVKGGGLPPRVDVVGFNRQVDWETLLQRLRAVASSRGPVVR